MEYNIGDRIVDDKIDMTITDKHYEKDNRGYLRLKYKYHCNICGYNSQEGYRGGKLINGGFVDESCIGKHQCRCCSNRIVIPEINSISVTHPQFSKYFMNGEDKIFSYNSNVRVDIKCPDCGTIEKNMPIARLIDNGFSCKVCSDNFSIGERIVYYLLSTLQIEFQKEYRFPNNKKRYDFYISSLSMIIEVHGQQHYMDKNDFWDSHLKDQPKIDKAKEEYAKSHGIERYIVIDARKSDIDFIINSIMESDLRELLTLDTVDWNEMKFKIANNNIVKDMCLYWQENPNVTIYDLSRKYNYSETSIRKYIKLGCDIGWCTNDKSHYVKNQSVVGNHHTSNPLIYEPLDIYFKSVRLCSENLYKLLGLEKSISQSTIRYYLNNKLKGFKYITMEDYNNAVQEGKQCYGEPFEERYLVSHYHKVWT